MKRKLIVGVLSAVFALVMGAPAEAVLILGPGDADWTTDQASNMDAADIEALTGISGLTELYKAEAGVGGNESGGFASSYETTFGAGNETALIEYISGAFITCPECILVAKDGSAPPPGVPPPAQYLFDIGTWDGQEDISLVGLWPGVGSFSHLSIWGGEQTTDTTEVTITTLTTEVTITPEPATLALFGSGLAIAAARLRRRKTASQL